MKFIETEYFRQQLDKLKGKYFKIQNDYREFKGDFDIDFAVELWRGLYKQRWKNSSIPTGKRWWLRFIIKVYNGLALPILIYAKTIKRNVSEDEIISALEITLKELQKMNIW